VSDLAVDLTVARRTFSVRAAFVLRGGERLALFGPSGAGKTTLLEAIAGLLPPSKGESRLGDVVVSLPPSPKQRAIAPSHRAVGRVSLVRQPTTLFPHLDVASNIAYGSSLKERARELMSLLGLEGLATAHPVQLSGGQAQRVALARALARPFELLLLDEPMSAMDQATRTAAWAAIDTCCEAEGASALLVTHDLGEAQAFGERLAVIDRGEILEIGDSHEVVAAPSTRHSAEVLGYRSFLRLSVKGPRAERAVSFAIDPARVRMGAAPEAGIVFTGRVLACTPYRAGFRVSLGLRDGDAAELPGIGSCAVLGESEVVIEVDRRVTLGMDILATAVGPPALEDEPETGRTFSAGRETPI
jgi:ABC-type sulfate/molybdate transport systems ATPase subunit